MDGTDPLVANPKPAKVSRVVVLRGDKENVIVWDSVPGGGSYDIYFRTSSGVTTTNGTKIINVKSPYRHTGRTNGTTYYYIVVARNAAGSALASSQVSGKPGARTWSGTSAMDVPTNSVIETAVNGRGEVLLTGTQYTGSEFQLWAKRYRPGSGWSATETLTQGAFLTAPKAALNNRGDGLIVWQAYDGLRNNLQSIDFRYATQTWGPQRSVENYDGELTFSGDTGEVYEVSKVFLDDTGLGMVAWTQSGSRSSGNGNDTYVHHVYSATFTAQAGWSPRYGLDAPIATTDDYSGAVDLAMNAQGQAALVWTRAYDVAGTTVYHNWQATFAPGLGWSATTRLDTGAAWLGGPKVAVDQTGNALTAWYQAGIPLETAQLWTARYAASTRTWAAPEQRLVVPDAPYVAQPALALNERGDATIVYRYDRDTLQAIRAPVGGAWTAPVKINTTSFDYEDSMPTVSVDYAGNSQIVWIGRGTRWDAIAARFTASTGTWAAPKVLNASANRVWAQYLGQDSHGNAWAFFKQERVLGDPSFMDLKLNRFVTP